ncbi:magnesium transporter CorA [Candidatus Micrarchaeota archaeon]|nr:magnesium transporter CorA [Candidatus Micrarchaeota archaeon]
MPDGKYKKPLVKVEIQNDKVILALEEKGFAVGLLKDGKTLKKEARRIEEFLDIVQQSNVTWIDYVVDDFSKEAPVLGKALGFSEGLLKTLSKHERSGYEDLDSEMGMMIPAILVQGFDVKINPLMLLMKQNLIVTLHTTELRRFFRLRRYAETFLRKVKPTLLVKDKITLILIRILYENNTRNFDHLREIEENADKVSEMLANPKTPREKVGPMIHEMKHALITYLTGLWTTVDVLNTLRYGDPEVLTDDQKLLDRIGVLIDEVNTQIGLAEHLSEVLASGLEVVQSIYNNQLQILNNKMALLVAYLTILGTAVLVPNTLATALSNPVFNLGPQDMWWYVGLLVASTVFSTLIAYLWVKSRGLLPKRADRD